MKLPSDYCESRQTFQALAAHLGAKVRSFVCDGENDGTVLTTDVAYLGPEAAPTLVVIASGTHGVEGYAGAACQFRFMETYPAHSDRLASSGIAFLLVHAVNPWGFYHDRRVTREGVDLNRNFVDFPVVASAQPAYDAYHSMLVSNFRPLPRGIWNEFRLLRHGLTRVRRRQLQAAVTGGQRSHPDGLFFGGTAPVQSRRVLEAIVQEHVTGRERVILLDIHTGLGAWGVGELISTLPSDDPDFREMSRWFGGSLHSMADGDAVSAAVAGTLTADFGRMVPCKSYAIGLEFGTRNPLAVLNALRADQWYHNNAGRLSARERDWARRKMRNVFAVTDQRWIDKLIARFDEVMQQLARGLGAT